MLRLSLLISAFVVAIPLWAADTTLTIIVDNETTGKAIAWDRATYSNGTWAPIVPQGSRANVPSLQQKSFTFTGKDNRGHSVSVGWGQYDSTGKSTHQCIGTFSYDHTKKTWTPDSKTPQMNCALKPMTTQTGNATYALKMYTPQ